MQLNDLIKSDLYRYYGGEKIGLREKSQLFGFKYTKVLRKTHYWKDKNKCLYYLYAYRLSRLQLKYGFQISTSSIIGKGLYIGHFGTVVVNPNAVLGDNVNLSPNVVIGKQNRGNKKGSPCLGDSVWVGSGAKIVGKIVIGDDVLIAPNAYVNFDVPSHSIVIGNPGKIVPRDNATEGYIVNKV